MSTPPKRPASPDGLFLWVMHRFAEVFKDHAIIKGEMALRLIDSPRSTTDIDYVFVPYRSKKEVCHKIERVLAEIEDAQVDVAMHSKMLRAEIRIDDVAIQIEVNMAESCDSIAMSTGAFARALEQSSRIVRIMSLSCALARPVREFVSVSKLWISTSSVPMMRQSFRIMAF